MLAPVSLSARPIQIAHYKSQAIINIKLLHHKGDLPPPFFLGAAACHGGVGGPIGPIASKEGRFYNRPGVVTQKAKELFHKKMVLRERGLSLLILARLSCAFSAASLVLGMPIIANVSFATLDF